MYIQTLFENGVGQIPWILFHQYVANRGEYDWCLSQIRHYVNALIQNEVLLPLPTHVTTSFETREIC